MIHNVLYVTLFSVTVRLFRSTLAFGPTARRDRCDERAEAVQNVPDQLGELATLAVASSMIPAVAVTSLATGRRVNATTR